MVSANTGWNLVNFRSGLICAARDKGWTVVAAVPPDALADAALRVMGCTVEPIALDSAGLSPTRDLNTTVQYWRLMRRHHVRQYWSWTAKANVYGSIAARLCRVRAVPNISGLGSVFIGDSMLTRVLKQMYRVAFSKAQTVFFQNETDRDLFVTAGLVSAGQAGVLPGSGIDLDHFRPTDRPLNSDSRPVFLMIARLLRDKGVEEYVAAAAALKERGCKARFQLLGEVGAANPTAVPRSQLDAWLAEETIEYLGKADDVRPYIASADCIVLPSYREGTARVLLEASAMGKPVVATDVPGCREPVDHGRTGLLCAVRSAEALEDAFARMMSITALERQAMGLAGRAKMEAEYDQRIVIQRYMSVLAR